MTAQTLGDWRSVPAVGGISNTTTAVEIQPAPDPELALHVTDLQLSWEALTTATVFAIRCGTDGPIVLFRFKIPAASAGSASFTFPTPLRGVAGTNLDIVTLTASTAGAVFANLGGYVAR